MSKIVRVVAVFVSVLLFAAAALAQPPVSKPAPASKSPVLLFAPAALGQEAQEPRLVEGIVRGPTGLAVEAARVVLSHRAARRIVTTDADGAFRVEAAQGEWNLAVSHPSYRTLTQAVSVAAQDLQLDVRLAWATAVEAAVTVVGARAGDDAPVSKRNLGREEIERLSFGQDVPQLLQYTPSMNWYSDSGVGSNYSYFSLRGIQQSRINMTYDGAPLNDPAEHALFFNNFHDFIAEVDSIQVQRGVGTSQVGSPAYGGSVNFASPGPSSIANGDARLTLGSYATASASLGYDSGLIGAGFWITGRFSYANTDGYRDSSGNRHNTFFWNAGWQGERSSLKFNGFSGRERGQLAYLAVEPEILADDRRFNPLGAEDREEFGQDFLQVKYNRALGDATVLDLSAYYNGAGGWFQLWDDPVAQTDLLRFGIDQGFYGAMATLTTGTDDLTATLGAHFNDFSGDHFLDTDNFGRLYTNTGFKQTINGFGKLEYRLRDTILFGDLQLRWARFRYQGDIDLGSVQWTFADPKVGVRQVLAPGLSVYGSVGRAQREPARLDLLLGEDNASVAHDLGAVRPESVVDFELGVNYNSPQWAVAANFYAMEFRDEIALTGELSEVGLPLRRNVDRSFRRGFELDLRWMPARNWALLHSLNVSRNRIAAWTQFYDVYDAAGGFVDSTPIAYTDVPHALTPAVNFNAGVEYANPNTDIAVIARHIGAQHLDNTGIEAFRTPAFTTVDLHASQHLGTWWPHAAPRVRLSVNNLLNNQDALPSGYSYQFLNRNAAGTDTLDGISYFYPLATFNAVVTLQIGF